jgi:hypothetical protein
MTHRADAGLGAVFGAVHGLVAGAIALLTAARTNSSRSATPMRSLARFRVRRLISRITFGTVLGFLYAVPRALS